MDRRRWSSFGEWSLLARIRSHTSVMTGCAKRELFRALDKCMPIPAPSRSTPHVVRRLQSDDGRRTKTFIGTTRIIEQTSNSVCMRLRRSDKLKRMRSHLPCQCFLWLTTSALVSYVPNRGFAPAPREPTPPPLTEEEQAAMEEARMQAKAERKALKHMEKEEKRAQKEERRKDKHAKRAVKHERRDGSRSRHRSEEPLDRDGRRRDDRSPRDRRESNDRRRREPSHEQDRRERRRSRSPAPRRY